MYLIPVKNNRCGLRIVVQPKARKTKLIGLYDGMLKLAVAAPPVDGKANKQVVSFLSDLFRVRKSDVEIIAGVHSRKKVCVLGDLQERDLRMILKPYLDDDAEA